MYVLMCANVMDKLETLETLDTSFCKQLCAILPRDADRNDFLSLLFLLRDENNTFYSPFSEQEENFDDDDDDESKVAS